jgi:hypothetical protein
MDPLRARRRVSDWSPCKVSGELRNPHNVSEVRDESNPNSVGRSLTFLVYKSNFLNMLSQPIDAGSSVKVLQLKTLSVSRLVSVPNSSGSCCSLSHHSRRSVLRLTNPTTLSGKVPNSAQDSSTRCSKSVKWPIDSGSLLKLTQKVMSNLFSFGTLWPKSSASSSRLAQPDRSNVWSSGSYKNTCHNPGQLTVSQQPERILQLHVSKLSNHIYKRE